MARLAIVDVGSDSTELLVVEPAEDGLRELDRRRAITMLATRVDATGVLSPVAVDAVMAALDDYDAVVAELGCDRVLVLLTSAARDAADGERFRAALARRYDAVRVLEEREEAELAYRAATADLGVREAESAATAARHHRDKREPIVVIDVGGGSTEIVGGAGAEVTFWTSVRVGAVRQLERCLRSDPPAPDELRNLRREVRERIARAVPPAVRAGFRTGIAFAGADSWLPAAAGSRDSGRYVLRRDYCEAQIERLSAMTATERAEIAGIDPLRGKTILVGAAILLEAMLAFGLDGLEISRRGLAYGAALQLVA